MKLGLSFLVLVATTLIGTSCSQTPQQKRDHHLETGKRMLKKKDFARALLEFKNAAQAMPQDTESYYEIGVALQSLGDMRNAAGAFRRATQLDPKNTSAQLAYAELLSLSRDPATLGDAESMFKTVLSATPNDPRAMDDLAVTEFKLGRTDQATEELALSLQKAPSYVQTYFDIVRVKLAQKDVPGAEDTLVRATQAVPKSLEARMTLARFYVATRRLAPAEVQLHKALEIDPKHLAALMELGRIQLATGRSTEAEQTFRAVSQLPDPGAKTIHAGFLLHQGNADAGIAELEKLIKSDGKDRGVRTELIRAYLAHNRAGDAERLITEVLKKSPKDVDSLLQRAEVYMVEGKVGRHSSVDNDITEALHARPQDANAHYVHARLLRLRGDDLSARQELTEAIRVDPSLLRARLELAGSLLSANDGKTALETLDTAPANQKSSEAFLIQRNWALIAAQRYPEARTSISALLAKGVHGDPLIQDGILKMEAKDVSGARTSFGYAIETNPRDVRALRRLMGTYQTKEQANAKLKEYAAKYPDSAQLQAFAAETLMVGEDTASARRALTQAQKLSPGNSALDLVAAKLEIQDRRLDEARKILQRLIASGNQLEQAGLWLGRVEEAAGNYQQAIKDYQIAAGVNDRNWQTLNDMAYCMIMDGRTDEALKYAQQAKELVPNNLEVIDTLGWAYFNKGLYDSAVKELAPLADAPRAVERYHLAMAYFKAGDVVKGQTVLRSALKIDAKIPEALVAQEMARATALMSR